MKKLKNNREYFYYSDRLSRIWGDYHICEECGVVGRDMNANCIGHPCFRCNIPNKSGGLLYFPIQLVSLLDLIEGHYGLLLNEKDIIKNYFRKETNLDNSIAIYFCTLGEVLLSHFLKKAMSFRNVQYDYQMRILDDNLYTKDRAGKVFKTTTNGSWKSAIKDIDSKDFSDVFQFYLDVNEQRNILLHSGMDYNIDFDFAEKCYKNTPKLLELFVGLHNKYNTKDLK